jgi:hypothetical protein
MLLRGVGQALLAGGLIRHASSALNRKGGWMRLRSNRVMDEIYPRVKERLVVNAEGATVLGSIPASSGIVESEGQQMKQC